MTSSNVALSNYVGGELSPVMYGRTDLPIYKRGLARAQNFFIISQGPCRYRPGFRRVHHTRRNGDAVFIPFQFNDTQAYLIEASDLYFRFYKDEGIITETAKTITGATQANPCVITSVAHGYTTGDEAFINDVVGMTQLNGKSYVVTRLTADTFSLATADGLGTAINSTGYTAYSSGGTASKIYEIETPYLAADVSGIQYTQNADTMYLDHQFYEPRKLTRTAHTSWTIARYSRTADPFTTAVTITGATQANPGVITAASHGRAVGDEVYIDSIVGMTQLNHQHYLVNTVPTANTLTLKTMAGVVVDTSAYTAYSSGGKLEHIGNASYPRACTFTSDARLLHGGTASKPESIWGSKSPSTGTTQYDNFTTGSAATDAVIFTLAPVHGQVNTVEWLANTDKFIVAGTFGTVRRIYGSTEQEALTPTNITAKSVNTYGADSVMPVSLGTTVFYVQRGRQILRSFEFDYAVDGYISTDRNLIADHLTYPGIRQILGQQGSNDLIWAAKDDGAVLALTFKDKEDISGWQRHYIGGSHVNSNGKNRGWGKVRWFGTMGRPTSQVQLWAIVERVINGVTDRSVEFMTDPPVYPDVTDFYTGQGNKEADHQRYENYKYEQQKNAVHLDMASTYDGRDYGTAASATITPSDTTGDITITSSASVFTASMVGRQIWKAYDENGEGGGRAEITGYTSATEVDATVLVDFDDDAAIAPGFWYLTTNSLSGLEYLEGETVGVCADGGPENDGVVASGALTLEKQASVVHVGLKYLGILQTLNIDQGGVTGSAQSKKRNIAKTVFRFLNSGGASFGTDLYTLQQITFHEANDLMDRPTPLYNGNLEQPYEDEWALEKSLYLVQDKPLPCTVVVMDVFTDTTDE